MHCEPAPHYTKGIIPISLIYYCLIGDALALLMNIEVCVCVCVDDWEDAYQKLGQAVKDYLLLEEQEEGDNDNRASPDNTSTGVFGFGFGFTCV